MSLPLLQLWSQKVLITCSADVMGVKAPSSELTHDHGWICVCYCPPNSGIPQNII